MAEPIDRFNSQLLSLCATSCARLVASANLDDADKEAIRLQLGLLLDYARDVRDPGTLVWAKQLREQFGDLG